MVIRFSNEAINLFKYADQLSAERVQLLLCPDSSALDKWDTHRQVLYTNGSILGLLREEDARLLDILSTKPDDTLKRDIICLLRWTKEKCDEHAKKFFEPYAKTIAQSGPERCAKQYPALTEDNILEWTDAYNAHILSEAKAFSPDKQLMFLYIYLGYDFYCDMKNRCIEVEQANIKNLYADLQDSNFRRYGLIPVDQERELIIANPCRIYDKTLDRTFFLIVQPQIASVLHDLYAAKRIGKLSFRGIDTKIYPERCTMGYIMEEIEYGLQFKLNVQTLPKVTKLFSKNYHDQLWVSVSNSEMHFEELCDDFKTQDEAIVTQLVHLLYKVRGSIPVITHIDHEYLFYSIEEYERRLEDPTIKGKAQKRIKTFKVDEANVEMNYLCNAVDVQDYNNIAKIRVPFLYFVLNAYFIHKDLLIEYFKEILE